MGYTIYTAAKLFAENNYYNGGTRKGSIVNDSVSANDISSKYPGSYTETGSVLAGSNFSLTAKTELDNTHLSNAGESKIAAMIAEQTNKLGADYRR